jgi:hypothetical protein
LSTSVNPRRPMSPSIEESSIGTSAQFNRSPVDRGQPPVRNSTTVLLNTNNGWHRFGEPRDGAVGRSPAPFTNHHNFPNGTRQTQFGHINERGQPTDGWNHFSGKARTAPSTIHSSPTSPRIAPEGRALDRSAESGTFGARRPPFRQPPVVNSEPTSSMGHGGSSSGNNTYRSVPTLQGPAPYSSSPGRASIYRPPNNISHGSQNSGISTFGRQHVSARPPIASYSPVPAYRPSVNRTNNGYNGGARIGSYKPPAISHPASSYHAPPTYRSSPSPAGGPHGNSSSPYQHLGGSNVYHGGGRGPSPQARANNPDLHSNNHHR